MTGGDRGWPGGDLGVAVPLSLLAEPSWLALASLSGKPELVRGEERSENGAWGKAEQGQGWAVVPGARAALLSPSAPLPCPQQINHRTVPRERGGRLGHSLRRGGRGAWAEQTLPWAGAGRHWARFGGTAQDKDLSPAPNPCPSLLTLSL